jgi:hypothetical protein
MPTRWDKVPRVLRPVLQPLRQQREFCAWTRSENAFIAFMGRGDFRFDNQASSGDIGVVIEPWPPFVLMPWYMLTLALGLQKLGRRVWLIWDDMPYGKVSQRQRRIQAGIERVLQQVPASLRFIRLSTLPPTESAIGSEVLAEQIKLNMVMQFRGEALPPTSVSFRAAIQQPMQATAGRIESLLQQRKFDYLLVPGGMYQSTGLFMACGAQHHVRVASVDSGPGVILVGADGIAAYLADITRAFRALPTEDQWVVIEAQNELQRRMQGRDVFAYQTIASSSQAEPIGALLPLNQSFDTSALGRHRVFGSQTEWMLETVAWVLEHTDESIVVRRHPVERKYNMQSTDDYAQRLHERFGPHPRLRYIAAESAVNTYDLIREAKVVVPHVSTVGIEAAVLGKPVVSQSASYYADLGFVWSATSREEYFNFLRRGLAGELVVTAAQQEAAWRCYYLTQVCNFYHTSFDPLDFEAWVQTDPNVLLASSDVQDILRAIDRNTPLSLIRYNEFKLRQVNR